jgi:hypothetical protein
MQFSISQIALYRPIIIQSNVYRVQLKSAEKFWVRVPHTRAGKHVSINISAETFNLSLMAERVDL